MRKELAEVDETQRANRFAKTRARSKNLEIARSDCSPRFRASDAGASPLIARFFHASTKQAVLVWPGPFVRRGNLAVNTAHPDKTFHLVGLGTEWRTETATAAARGPSEAGGQCFSPAQPRPSLGGGPRSSSPVRDGLTISASRYLAARHFRRGSSLNASPPTDGKPGRT